MENDYLAKLMATDRDVGPLYRGLYSVDNLNDSLQYVNGGVQNLILINAVQPDSNTGHFILVYLDDLDHCAYLDPLGNIPGYYSQKLDLYLEELADGDYESAPFPLQQSQSDVCGRYCYVWAKSLASEKSIDSLFLGFRCDDLKFNDNRIVKIFKKLLHK